jgi:hypothetical protein
MTAAAVFKTINRIFSLFLLVSLKLFVTGLVTGQVIIACNCAGSEAQYGLLIITYPRVPNTDQTETIATIGTRTAENWA